MLEGGVAVSGRDEAAAGGSRGQTQVKAGREEEGAASGKRKKRSDR